jgi:ABC-type multidrug transport system ATPase subunit
MLSMRKTFGEIRGDVLVNGQIPGPEWKRITGYVLQDDVFIATQTAREHLTFVSRLKLPANMSSEERDARVESVLEDMGLQEVSNSQIGDASRKGLSGGEKKRLSIAAELIGDPAILFLGTKRFYLFIYLIFLFR